MNKNIKTKILIATLITITLLLILPCVCNAIHVGDNDKTFEQIENGEVVTGHWNSTEDNIFMDRDVFCCWRGQPLKYSNDTSSDIQYKIDRLIEVDSDDGTLSIQEYDTETGNTKGNPYTVDNGETAYWFTQGLLSILAHESEDTYNNAVQCALWAYIQNNIKEEEVSWGSKVFGFRQPTTDIIITDDYIARKNKEERFENARTWLRTAENIMKHHSGTIYTGKIAKLCSIDNKHKDNRQEILVVKRSEKIESENIKISFKKVDISQNPLSNAKIQISGKANDKNANVEAIYGLDDDNCLISASDGEFGTIEIEPKKASQGFLQIDVREVSAPYGYELYGNTITLRIHYDVGDRFY